MIDKLAIISPSVKLAPGVSIGPYTIIGENVEIGEGTCIHPHVVIKGRTKIGCNNKIFQFASVGEDPQDLKYKNEDTLLEIGDNNIIREFCSLHRGTQQGKGVTRIGHNNLLMAYVHIAHDCVLGNDIVFANNASLAGHVIIEDNVVLGGFAKIAQFCTIGTYSFVAAATGVPKDVPPYIYVSGYHGKTIIYGLNVVGLRRKGFSNDTIKKLRDAYRIIYQENLTTMQAIPKLEEMVSDCPEVQLFVDMLKNSKRGIIR